MSFEQRWPRLTHWSLWIGSLCIAIGLFPFCRPVIAEVVDIWRDWFRPSSSGIGRPIGIYSAQYEPSWLSLIKSLLRKLGPFLSILLAGGGFLLIQRNPWSVVILRGWAQLQIFLAVVKVVEAQVSALQDGLGLPVAWLMFLLLRSLIPPLLLLWVMKPFRDGTLPLASPHPYPYL